MNFDYVDFYRTNPATGLAIMEDLIQQEILLGLVGRTMMKAIRKLWFVIKVI